MIYLVDEYMELIPLKSVYLDRVRSALSDWYYFVTTDIDQKYSLAIGV